MSASDSAPHEVSALAAPDYPVTVGFTYTNWRGETAKRRGLVVCVWHGSTRWHPETQWFMRCLDTEKDEERDFALKDMRDFKFERGAISIRVRSGDN